MSEKENTLCIYCEHYWEDCPGPKEDDEDKDCPWYDGIEGEVRIS